MAKRKQAGVSKLTLARKTFVANYIATHPKQSVNRARANAIRVFSSKKTAASLPRALKAAHTKQYYKPHYPRLQKAMLRAGKTRAEIRRADTGLFGLNQRFYKKRDNPPQVEHYSFPDSHYVELDDGTRRFEMGREVTEMVDAPPEAINMEHYDDIHEWWADNFGEDTWDNRDDIYPQEG